MKPVEKIGLLALMIIIAVLLFLLFTANTPNFNYYRTVTLSGNITRSENMSEIPSSVLVYAPPSDLANLCGNRLIAYGPIQWTDNISGKYSISFTIPVDMDIVLTTSCSSCEHELMHINNGSILQYLLVINNTCGFDVGIPETKEKILERTRSFFDGMEANLVDKDFNVSEMADIKESIREGRENIAESGWSTSNANESLLKSLYAYWFAWNAQTKVELFDLKNCIYSTNEVLQSHSDDCYIPDYTSFSDYVSANVSYNNFANSNFIFNRYIYSINDSDKMRSEIGYTYNTYYGIMGQLSSCQEAFNTINKTMSFQEPYCNRRSLYIDSSYIVWLIVAIFAGMVINEAYENGRRVRKKH